jgi:hypothetical protein
MEIPIQEMGYHRAMRRCDPDPTAKALARAVPEVLRISDRKHEAWDALRAALSAYREAHPREEEK